MRIIYHSIVFILGATGQFMTWGMLFTNDKQAFSHAWFVEAWIVMFMALPLGAMWCFAHYWFNKFTQVGG